LDDKIEKNEMGEACVMYGGEKRCIQGCGGNPEERDPGVDERVILMDRQEVGCWHGLD
jgi:hypothetical protein